MSPGGAGGFEHIGPEPWRVEPLRDYDGPPPVPVEAVLEGIADEEGWTVDYGVYVGQFDGATRWIPITFAEHPDHGRWQWFPIQPDQAR